MSGQAAVKLTKADFTSDQVVRWCPGCGDYSILANVQRTLPELGIPKENVVFISGIGCSSRFPYYMDTYGFHTVHGRAPALASGLKITRPELSVWIITGDGDALSIGGNHFIHVLRRNLDMNMLLINNRIYGLTKGQYSPTSEKGKVTKSSPLGSADAPINAVTLALAAEATFVARALDTDAKGMQAVLKAAAAHKGTSLVEIYQNCNIFNDGAFQDLTDKATRSENTILLEHGQPMIFGKERNRGIRLNGLQPEVVTLGDGVSADDLLKYDAKRQDSTLAHLVSRMDHPEFPVPLGVFRAVERPVYEETLDEQVETDRAQRGVGELGELLNSGHVWEVE